MKVNYTGDRITVGEAAEMLSMNPQRVRVLMQRGKLPIGIADRTEGDKSYTYYIYRGRVTAFLNGLDLIGIKEQTI